MWLNTPGKRSPRSSSKWAPEKLAKARWRNAVAAVGELRRASATPQIFVDMSPKRRSGEVYRTSARRMDTIASEVHFTMHVMLVTDFLERYGGGCRLLEPHQQLKARGLVVPYYADMRSHRPFGRAVSGPTAASSGAPSPISTSQHPGEVLFVSHEWLGFSHPDPRGDQLRELCLALQRLSSGAEDEVQSSWESQLLWKTNNVVRGSEWKQRLVGAWLWLDYISIPQLNVAVTSSAPNSPGSPEVGPRVFASESSVASAAAAEDDSVGPEDTFSDHRLSKHADAEALRKAVESIPAYVELCSLLVIFAPNCVHCERKEAQGSGFCNYASWRRRGWCRAEIMGACLAPSSSSKECLLIRGGECTPEFIFPTEAFRLLPGSGDFTCCQLNHRVDGRCIPCDKAKVGRILNTIINGKVTRLLAEHRTLQEGDSAAAQRALNMYRFLICSRHYFVAGLLDSRPDSSDANVMLDGSGAAAPAAADDAAIERFKLRLKWRVGDDVSGTETGWTLLKFACIAGDDALVGSLLGQIAKLGGGAARRRALIDAPLRGTPKRARRETAKSLSEGLELLANVRGMTNLAMALWLSRSESIIGRLLDAGADAFRRDGVLGGTPIVSTAWATRIRPGDPLPIWRAWFERFPQWDLEDRARVVGLPLLHLVLYATPYPVLAPLTEKLLALGADPTAVGASGRTTATAAVLNHDCDARVLARTLEAALAAGIGVDRPNVPATPKWRLIFMVMTLRFKRGSRNRLVQHLATLNRATPLMLAARQGDFPAVDTLLRMGADRAARNAVGMTALDLARLFGPFPDIEARLAEAPSI